jgi:hypothetical protein
MYISGNPKSKQEAMRWVRIGIELTVMDHRTNRPIALKDGTVIVLGSGWTAGATLRDGIVVKLN